MEIFTNEVLQLPRNAHLAALKLLKMLLSLCNVPEAINSRVNFINWLTATASKCTFLQGSINGGILYKVHFDIREYKLIMEWVINPASECNSRSNLIAYSQVLQEWTRYAHYKEEVLLTNWNAFLSKTWPHQIGAYGLWTIYFFFVWEAHWGFWSWVPLVELSLLWEWTLLFTRVATHLASNVQNYISCLGSWTLYAK